MLGVDTQSTVWAFGYGALVMLCDRAGGATAPPPGHLRRRIARRSDPGDSDAARRADRGDSDAPIPWRTRGRWIFFAAVPSALMLGVTNHIASDVASMPLLWVLPLSLYLLSFIIAFGRRPDGPVTVRRTHGEGVGVPLALSFLGLSRLWFSLPPAPRVVLRGRDGRPRSRSRANGHAPDHLTEFYLLLSVGGVVGGILAALVAAPGLPLGARVPHRHRRRAG